MTITVVKQDLMKVSQMYLEALNKKFFGIFMTPATIERIKYELEQMRLHHARQERNPVWEVRFEVQATGAGSITLTPILEGVSLVERPTRYTVYR